MKNDCMNLIGRILLLLLLSLGAGLSGCGVATSPTISARYTINLAEPAQKRVVVQAVFSELPSGNLDLAMPRTWGASQNLDQQVRWIQVKAVGGKDITLSQQENRADDPFERWQIVVPENGSLSITYSIELAGNDGAAPSFVQSNHALLLTRSLFIFPATWLDQPGELPVGVQVRIESPQGWPIYTPWPDGADEATYRLTSLDDLLDAVIALGQYRGYAIRQGENSVNVLLAPGIAYENTETWAKSIGRNVLSLESYFGAAPNGAASVQILAIVVANDATSVLTSESLASGAIVARADPTAPPDQLLMREALNLWISGALRAAPRWALAPEEAWRTIGWADYLVWRMDFDAGNVSAIQYWDRLRRIAQSLDSNSKLNAASLSQAAAGMYADPALYALVRDKGHLAALLLDQRLQTDSDGSTTLSAALRQLWQKHNTYQTGAYITTQELLQELGDMSDADYTLLYNELIEGLGTLDLDNVPQFAGPPAGETRVVRSPDGVQLAYQWLDGPSDKAAIYLEGGPGMVPYVWMYEASESLLPYLDVAYLDQRGCGRSDDPGPGGYTTDAFVNDIETLREALGAGQITLIGQDWGGYLALTYAARYPERVSSLILISPIPSFPQTVQAQVAMLSSQMNQHADLSNDIRNLQKGVHSFDNLSQLDQVLIATGAYGSDLALVQERLQAAYAHYGEIALLPPGLLLENTEILPNLVARDGLLERDVEPALGRAQYPVLILHGERDQAVGAKYLDAFAKQIGGQMRQMAGVGHFAHIEQPETVLDEIIAFLQKN